MKVLPSGEQVELTAGPLRAVAVEVGGGLRTLTAGGRDVLDGYGPGEPCPDARGTPLVPWPNRLADGRYGWHGVSHQVALTEPERHNAIHGFCRFRSWQVRERSADRAVLGIVLHPLPGWPFPLDIAVEYRLRPDGLTVATTATNLGDEPAPWAAGQHPYLSAGGGLVDDCTVRLDAACRLPTDDRGLPTGREPVAGTEYDLRTPRRLGDVVLDHAFTDLARDSDGRARLEFTTPAGDACTLWVDAGYPYLELFTGDPQPPERRRRSLGVEPMTCPPNGLATGEGIAVLDPGTSRTTTWGLDLYPS